MIGKFSLQSQCTIKCCSKEYYEVVYMGICGLHAELTCRQVSEGRHGSPENEASLVALVTRNHNPNILPKVLEVPNPIFSMQFPDLISTRLRDWTGIILLSRFVGDTECFGTSVTSPFNVTIIFYPPKKNAGLERCEANTLDPRNHTQTQASISNLR